VTQSASDSALRQAVELRLIATDLRWCWGIARDSAAQIISSPFPLLCVLPYLSLIIVESQTYLIRVDPTLAQNLTLQYADVIEQSRHRMKLFDDTHLGMEGVADYFSDELMAAHRTKFIESVRLPFAAQWKGDLGLSTYDDRQIATTHVIHFNLGTPPDMIIRKKPMEPKGMGVDMGGYLATLTSVFKSQLPQMDWDAGSFLARIDPGKLEQKDVRSTKYYRSLFGGRLPIGILAALDTFRSALNTIDVLMAADASPDSAEALFKIRFVTLYHALRGLQQLQSAHSRVLDSGAERRLSGLQLHSTTSMLQSDNARWFRNTLVHYKLATQCPTTALDFGTPLSGLVDFYFPGVEFTQLANQIQEHAERVARSLDEWAAHAAGA